MWHQLWSCSSVVITRSASSAPGDRSLTVTSAVVAPPCPAARSASLVTWVPPSCEMPMTTPSRGGRCAASSAGIARASRPGGRSSASLTNLASPIAACSDVPLPVVTMAVPSCAARRSRSTSCSTAASSPSRWTSRSAMAGSAAIISVMWYGGFPRNAGISDDAQGSGAPGSCWFTSRRTAAS